MLTEVTKRFPTSEEIYARIKSDCIFNQAQVQITYYDGIKDALIDLPFCQWNPIKAGGDIPWHRVYFFKYGYKSIWDREKKVCSMDGLYTILKSMEALHTITIPENFRIMTWNILSDHYDKQITNLKLRQDSILNYIRNADLHMVCLQEVTNDFYQVLSNQFREQYHLAKTDLATNNLVFMSKIPFSSVQLIPVNASKEMLWIKFSNLLQVFVVHLTSNYALHNSHSRQTHHQSHSGNVNTKRNLQLSQLLQTMNSHSNDSNSNNGRKCIPTMITGDFNTSDSIDILSAAGFLEAPINDFTYNPEENRLAKLLSQTQGKAKYDRLFYSSSSSFSSSPSSKQNEVLSFLESSVDTENPFSDHFPVIFSMQYDHDSLFIPNTGTVSKSITTEQQRRILSPNKFALAVVIPMKFWPQLASLSPQHHENHENGPFLKQKWMPHITLFLPFLEQLTNEEKEVIQRIIAKKRYFNSLIKIKDLSYFEQSSTSYTLIGQLSEESAAVLQDIYEEISQELNLAVVSKTDFYPHLTLQGLYSSKNEIEKFISSHWIDVEFPLKRLCYLNNINQQYYETIDVFGMKRFDGNILDFLHFVLRQFFVNNENHSEYEVKMGGSGIFQGDLTHQNNNVDIHDYDLLIVGKSLCPRDEFMKKLMTVLKKSGLFSDIRCIQNQHTFYVKIVSESISYDIHYVTGNLYKSYDRLDSMAASCSSSSSSNHVSLTDYSLIDLNSISLEKASLFIYRLHEDHSLEFAMKLKFVKCIFQKFGIYGLQYGYFPGISVAILISFFITNEEKENIHNSFEGEDNRQNNVLLLSSEEFLKKFCDFYLNYDYSNPILVHRSDHHPSSKDMSPMHIINPVRPHNNVTRTMTKSSFRYILEVFSVLSHQLSDHLRRPFAIPNNNNYLSTHYQKTEVTAYAVHENDLKLFANFFDSVSLKLILLFEGNDCSDVVIPSNQSRVCWEEKTFSYCFYSRSAGNLLGVNTVWEFLKSQTERNFGKNVFLLIK
jgi:poly(A) polymerase